MYRMYHEPGERHCPLSYEEQVDLALYDAILNNDMTQVKYLTQHTKRDLNNCFLVVRHKKHEFNNPMRLVSSCGHALMLKFLIEAGCDVNKISKRLRRTPVHMAVLGNNMSCLQLLIAARAKLDIRDVFGNSPCHYAAELGLHGMLDMMIRIGTQVNSQDITAKTPLMKAVRNNKTESTLRLIRANADLNIADNNNEVALHFAARNGSVETVDALISSGSLIDVQNLWGRSPLMEAVCYNNREVVQRLLAAGCDINKRECKSGDTALHIAVRRKYSRVVELLLQYILLSPSYTLNMLTSYDWDIHKYLQFLEQEGQEKSLFFIAADGHCYKTCLLLASLGSIDQSARPILQNRLENIDQTDSNHQNLTMLLEAMKTVIPLKHVCRNVIRKRLGVDLSRKIPALPIPLVVKDYLLFKSKQESVAGSK
ncbi:ankyrin repeat domain-containing protein 7 [Biomphalaria glabrata]|uniref:Ankyrin repeat domain-containing protein 7-like n=1 Tax=Biomphalaria glabrata TaxID=6526 RepID=A0A9U8EEU2_BIOGL|nr:ankyrin repeat domain-containing protein 7-like [Biomphalaria glabrata]KAI8768450.1 ankyrin repeat domain-containing protein 7-like [Biomphalaria glabrata]